MSNFAEVDNENKVIRVVVIKDSVPDGATFLIDLLGGSWVASSRKNRKRMAGIGSIYYPEEDGFKPPTPFPSWSWEKEAWRWEPPTPRPASNDPYGWNEESLSWEKVI